MRHMQFKLHSLFTLTEDDKNQLNLDISAIDMNIHYFHEDKHSTVQGTVFILSILTILPRCVQIK